MGDSGNKEIMPKKGRKLKVCTNRNPTLNGNSWGWIEDCRTNITWSNDYGSQFTYEDACKFVDKFNKKIQKLEVNDDQKN